MIEPKIISYPEFVLIRDMECLTEEHNRIASCCNGGSITDEQIYAMESIKLRMTILESAIKLIQEFESDFIRDLED